MVDVAARRFASDVVDAQGGTSRGRGDGQPLGDAELPFTSINCRCIARARRSVTQASWRAGTEWSEGGAHLAGVARALVERAPTK